MFLWTSEVKGSQRARKLNLIRDDRNARRRLIYRRQAPCRGRRSHTSLSTRLLNAEKNSFGSARRHTHNTLWNIEQIKWKWTKAISLFPQSQKLLSLHEGGKSLRKKKVRWERSVPFVRSRTFPIPPLKLQSYANQINKTCFLSPQTELCTLEPGMDVMPRTPAHGPYNHLNNLVHNFHHHTDQTKSLQELQNEVGALLEFRDLVIETFPDLKHKMASSGANSTITGLQSSSIVSR